jgi:hypothetical protein
MNRIILKLFLAFLAACALSLAAGAALGQKPVLRRMGIHVLGNQLTATFNYQDVFKKAIREKLKSGLPIRIVAQVFLEYQGKPVAFWSRSTAIVYDLWEEAFIVTDEDSRGKRKAKVKSAAEAIGLASIMWRSPVADIRGLAPGVYRLNVNVEVNPVSKEMVEKIRGWLAQPAGGRNGVDAQTNFFGSFVSIFVDRHIGQADSSLSVFSQQFGLGKP